MTCRRVGLRRGMSTLACVMTVWIGDAPTAWAQQPTVAAVSVVDDLPADAVLARLVSVDLEHVSVRSALATIATKANVAIQYQARTVKTVNKSVTVRAVRVPLGRVLTEVLAGTSLQAVPYASDGITIVAAADEGQGQGTVAGKVAHAKTQRPIADALVTLDGATSGVRTDADGMFRIPASAGVHALAIRAVGFVRQSRQVTVAEGQSVAADFQLQPSASVLDEVVVTGTVVATERKAIPNPITVLTAEDIERRGVTRVDQLLRGEVPGVITLEQGSAGYSPSTLGGIASSQVYARGVSTFRGANPMKTYVDGVEILDPNYLGTIDPKSIERIEIVTGPQAATVYGSGAIGGVMQVFLKKGAGRTKPDVTLTLKYGMLQSNVNTSVTPQHSDALNVSGGVGPEFTYTGTASFNSTGQWQPFLYARSYGASAGVGHTRERLSLTGSIAATMGANGTYSDYDVVTQNKIQSGEWGMVASNLFLAPSQIVSHSSSQTVSLNLDYRASSWWQHHLTVGTNQMDFDLTPQAPRFSLPSDTLYRMRSSSGRRVTVNYNTTLNAQQGVLSSTFTLGGSGSFAQQKNISGCTTAAAQTTYLACSQYEGVSVSQSIDDKSGGGFMRWQLGLLGQLYATFELRGERNRAYGSDHKIDWTPANGLTYTREFGDATIKLLGSYGRATRAPDPSWRLDVMAIRAGFEPSIYHYREGNPELSPEYSRGPQGGVELYYGNLGSLAVTYYRQTTTDLIQLIQVGSVTLTRLSDGAELDFGTQKYVNMATFQSLGWDGTGTLNLGPVALKGTYTWSASRVIKKERLNAYEGFADVGEEFEGVPTHSAFLSATYARGPASISLMTTYMGQMLTINNYTQAGVDVIFEGQNSRTPMYVQRKRNNFAVPTIRPGYAKSDMSASYRLTNRMSLTMNVTNLENSYGTEGAVQFPALGRQTLFGLTLR